MSSESALQTFEILLVEDSPSDANLTIRSFKNTKIPNNLSWVEDGESAMNYLRQEGQFANVPRPNLILLDLNLPGMDGREVLTEIKSDINLKRIPVVILTTSASHEDILRSYNLYANCYITKPIDILQFTKIVQLINDFWLTTVKLPPS
jgi:two-component system, chemotaxis family, response regulator Rcp1